MDTKNDAIVYKIARLTRKFSYEKKVIKKYSKEAKLDIFLKINYNLEMTYIYKSKKAKLFFC